MQICFKKIKEVTKLAESGPKLNGNKLLQQKLNTLN